MGRILFWLLLAVAAWLGWRLWRGQARLNHRDSAPASRGDEVLVECRMCGVRLPKSEALSQNEVYFCCAQHRDEFNATR